MIKNIFLKKKLARNWFSLLQEAACHEFQKIEIEYAKKKREKYCYFKKNRWTKNKNEGGGTYYTIKNGNVFDSIGVNFSEVSGKFNKDIKSQVFKNQKNSNYWAAGISIVAHMKNAKIPALHFNTRFIVTSKNWFGGGMDATPSLKDKKEEKLFHKNIKLMCDNHNKKYYPKYKKWCNNYFYLPHRKETRGIGGIFFDYKKDNWEKDFNFVQDVGLCFIECAQSIIRKKMFIKWTQKQKDEQLIKRGRYVEFNLLYDRGTKFGLNSGGNTEAILMSMPPHAKWK